MITSANAYIERLRAVAPSTAPLTFDAAANSVSVCFYSGAAVERVDVLTGEVFELVFDASGADLSRLNTGGAPVLNEHKRFDIGDQVGVIMRAYGREGRFFADLKISDRPELEGLRRDLEAGVVRNTSMGTEVMEYRDETDERGRLLRRVVTAWRPFEISLVCVPADPAAVTLAFTDKENSKMQINNETGAAAGGTLQTNSGAAAEIRRIALQHNLGAEFAERHVKAGIPVDTFRATVLDHLATAGDAHNIRGVTSAATVIRDEGDSMREGAVLAMVARATGKAPADQARPYYGLSAVQLAAECLNRRGVSTRGLSEARIVEMGLHTTSDFPDLLSGFAGKVLLDAYQAAPGALKMVAREASAPDFKTRYVLRRGEFPQLEEVPEHGEFKSGTIGEAAASYRLRTYGKIFGISRQALINDDLGAFQDAATMIGQSAADFEASLLVSILVSNAKAGPVMPDGINLFDELHGNIGTGAIDVAGVDAGRAKMRRQRGVDGSQIIDAAPRFLVAPVSKQAAAESLVATITPAAVATVNPFAGQLVPLADPRLDDADTAAWFLFADPQRTPALEYAYLAGAPGPQIEQQVGFEVDGLKIKCRLDFGAAAIDFRGVYRSTGI